MENELEANKKAWDRHEVDEVEQAIALRYLPHTLVPGLVASVLMRLTIQFLMFI